MKKTKEVVVSKLDEFSEKYSSLEILRAPIQLIPFGVGSAIDSLFGTRANEIQYNRLFDLINGIKQELNNLKESKINKTFLDSDEFYFLCRDIFVKVANTRELDKIKLFKNIFVNSISFREHEMSFIEVCNDILDQLSKADILLLKLIKQHNYFDKDRGYRGFIIRDDGSVVLANGEKEKTIKDFKLPNTSMLLASFLKLNNLQLIKNDTRLTALAEEFVSFVFMVAEKK